MKVSKQKIVTLFIFVIFILIESISLATYRTEAKSTSYENMRELIKKEASLTGEEEETLNLINEYRKQNGLKDLKTFSKLQEIARIKAEDIVNNDYFAHDSEALGTPFEMLKKYGIDYTIAGENLAGNQTPQKATDAWINSALHKENILDGEFEYTGICVIESPRYGKVFVQLFVGINN